MAGGFSGALVLHGEPGMGKTALLDDTVAAADSFRVARVARVARVESETRLGYAGPYRGKRNGTPSP